MIDGAGADEILTIRECAAILKLSRAYLYSACASGRLAHERYGQAVRVRRRDLDDFAKDHRREAGEGTPVLTLRHVVIR